MSEVDRLIEAFKHAYVIGNMALEQLEAVIWRLLTGQDVRHLHYKLEKH